MPILELILDFPHFEYFALMYDIYSLAWHEMRAIFGSVLWHFDLSLATPDFDWTNQETYILWEKHPLLVFLKPACR